MRETLIAISRQVRDAILNLPPTFDRGLEVCTGADGTPTSNIDKFAEKIILDYVEDKDTPLNVLSEEAGMVDRGYDQTLVIDPIDGTHNSILGIPLYSVSLAVGKSSLNDIEVGVVLNLVNNDLYMAEKTHGATLNGRPIKVKKARPGNWEVMVYMGRHAATETINVVQQSTRVRAMGCASLEMCMVAQGIFDAHYMNSNVCEKSIRVVDIAASALILREAGGDLVDLEGKRLDMPLDLTARSNFLAYGDDDVKEGLL
ncbi:MAG: inositol monophosphatase [Euryarchaeota archaeon]|nr:inositol monophosphatase [Euryarchaeota archaeon]